MKTIHIVAIALAMAQSAHAADDATSTPVAAPPAATASAATPSRGNGDFCLYAGSPPSNFKYHTLGRVKLGKGTYGGVRDELPTFVNEARAQGAEAITNYNGAQRFGFWPWRLVHPVLTGIAVKFDAGVLPDCQATGGSTLDTVMATNLEPSRRGVVQSEAASSTR